MQRECRGLVLDEAKDWAVVAMPYTRFFNYGERWASCIDWATAKVFEKMDGSLMTMVCCGHYCNMACLQATLTSLPPPPPQP